MTDEAQEETAEEETPVTTGSDQTQTETVTKADHEAAIKARLAQQGRAHDKEVKALDDQLKSKDDEMKVYKAAFEDSLKAKKAGLPEAVLSLLEKLTPIEQAEWLNNPDNVKPLERKRIPETPKKDEEGAGFKPYPISSV
jgi:hypothetical protein